jgi:hypothetical protein
MLALPGNISKCIILNSIFYINKCEETYDIPTRVLLPMAKKGLYLPSWRGWYKKKIT